MFKIIYKYNKLNNHEYNDKAMCTLKMYFWIFTNGTACLFVFMPTL